MDGGGDDGEDVVPDAVARDVAVDAGTASVTGDECACEWALAAATAATISPVCAEVCLFACCWEEAAAAVDNDEVPVEGCWRKAAKKDDRKKGRCEEGMIVVEIDVGRRCVDGVV